MTEWIDAQLANESDNPLWCNLVFYEPDIYMALYPEALPCLLSFNFRQLFSLHLAKVDLSSQTSIDQFNLWLTANYYQLDSEDLQSPECQYFYHMEHYLEVEMPSTQIKRWVLQQLETLMPMAQALTSTLMAPLNQK